MLTEEELQSIRIHLEQVSTTWSDLMLALYYLPASASQLISARFEDVDGEKLHLPEKGRFRKNTLALPVVIKKMISRRRKMYPHDIYIFQSHSNRVKSQKKPVTVIAFNHALRMAATGVTKIKVTSKQITKIGSFHAGRMI